MFTGTLVTIYVVVWAILSFLCIIREDKTRKSLLSIVFYSIIFSAIWPIVAVYYILRLFMF